MTPEMARKLDSERLTDRELLIYVKSELDQIKDDFKELKNLILSAANQIRQLEDFKLRLELEMAAKVREQRERNRRFMIYLGAGSLLLQISVEWFKWLWKK